MKNLTFFLGKLLCKDLCELLLEYLKEKCFECFSCHKIYTESPVFKLFEYIPETGRIHYACSCVCHDNLRTCINVCSDFGDYD